jgi:ribosome-binding protein aMBF1 (putative translation factor)
MEEFASCSVCSRTPLVGEQITVLRGEGGELAVCDLCRLRPRAEALGEPARRERVHTVAGAANVRRPSSPTALAGSQQPTTAQ